MSIKLLSFSGHSPDFLIGRLALIEHITVDLRVVRSWCRVSATLLADAEAGRIVVFGIMPGGVQ